MPRGMPGKDMKGKEGKETWQRASFLTCHTLDVALPKVDGLRSILLSFDVSHAFQEAWTSFIKVEAMEEDFFQMPCSLIFSAPFEASNALVSYLLTQVCFHAWYYDCFWA